MIEWLRKKLPAPMAAPETAELRGARRRLIAGGSILAALTLFWTPIARLIGAGAPALFLGLVVFLAIQGAFWLSAKNAADDAWLLYGEWRDE
ncbi:hypothetical protein [Novosphingobium gossypii]|uniref:hypothetical protein n=1 Tax=Novosphingobium gossypii TaxID=1604774 RepID=UPI003D1BCF69